MTPAAATPRPRRGTPLGRLFLAILLAQVALVGLLGAWSELGPRPLLPRPTPRLRWLVGDPEAELGLPGHAVLAEVSREGFSGALWRGGDSARLSAPAAPEFVERMVVGVAPGPGFRESAPVVSPPPTGSILPLLDLASEPGGDVRYAPGPGQSRLRWSGPLAELPVRVPSPLPVWTNTEVLLPTSVQVVAERNGGVLSAVLLPGGSGLAAADQEALRLAREFRFAGTGNPPGEEGVPPLVWGTVEFVWHTVEPAVRP